MKNSVSQTSSGVFCSSPVDFYGVYLLQTSVLSLHLLSLPDCNFSHVFYWCRSESEWQIRAGVRGVEMQVLQRSVCFLSGIADQTHFIRRLV